MTLYFFDDVFGLNFPFETAQGVLYRFAVLQFDFCQLKIHPQTHRRFTMAFTEVWISYALHDGSQAHFSVVSDGVELATHDLK